jgi:biotin carboxyl carrier protein
MRMDKVQVTSAKRTYDYELLRENGQWRVRHGDMVRNVDLVRRDGSRFSVVIDGWSYDMGIAIDKANYTIYHRSRSETFLIEAHDVARIKAQTGIGDRVMERHILAPMPGLIIHVMCQPGDIVEKGQVVLVMEAMKMENNIKSPLAGRIKTIHVETGKSADKGQLLVEFE